MGNADIASEMIGAKTFLALPIPVSVWKTAEEKITLSSFNQAAEQLFGPEIRSDIGKTAEAVYSEWPEFIVAIVQCQTLRKTIVRQHVIRLSPSSGEKHLECTWVWIGPESILFMARDLTEIKQMQTRSDKERKRYIEILQATRAGTWEWHVQTDQLFVNNRWAEMIGYDVAELAPISYKNCREIIIPAEDLERANTQLAKIFRKEIDYYECELRMKHKQGHFIWVVARGRVSKWTPDGSPLVMFGTHLDITDRKKYEIELKKARVDLEQKVLERTRELANTNDKLNKEFRERIMSQENLLKSERELEKERGALQESNIALKILMREMQFEKTLFEESISANLVGLIDPYLDKLKNTKLDQRQQNYIQILDTNLKNLASPFVRTSITMNLKFTPTEAQIANLIRENKTSKQIAELLSISKLTVEKHRMNIRKKLGILNQKVNLKTLLSGAPRGL